MKNKKSLLIAGAVAVIIAFVGIVLFLKHGGMPESDDILETNLSLLNSDEVPDYDLYTIDSLLRFESIVAELGTMKINQKKNVVFSFTNVCSTPLVITRIITNCGCTSVDWDKSPLRPGKKSEIRVTFEAEKKGVFFKKLFIYYAGGAIPMELAIKGEVR